MYLNVRGLVLRVSDYKDRDAILTLLTAEYGKLTVKARGLRRKNSPLAAACQLLCLGEFVLFEYREMYTVNEAHCVEQFQGLRSDLTKLYLGAYFAQVADVVSQEDLPNPELMSLVLNCLYALSSLQVSANKVKAVFEFRCSCIAGYAPDLSGCSHCGSPVPDRLDVSAGTAVCSRCHSISGGLRMPITPGMLDALRYIGICPINRILAFELPADALNKLSGVTETYLSTQLERGFSALDFYKNLLLE